MAERAPLPPTASAAAPGTPCQKTFFPFKQTAGPLPPTPSAAAPGTPASPAARPPAPVVEEAAVETEDRRAALAEQAERTLRNSWGLEVRMEAAGIKARSVLDAIKRGDESCLSSPDYDGLGLDPKPKRKARKQTAKAVGKRIDSKVRCSFHTNCFIARA